MTEYDLISALVAAIMFGSIFVCATVIIYHKISCTNRLRIRKVNATIPKIIVVNDAELLEVLNEVLPKPEDEQSMSAVTERLRTALCKIGGGR